MTPIKLTLTGTGTPMPSPDRAGPGQLVEIEGDLIQVDCGDRSSTQLMRAGVNPADITQLVLTHLHVDHTHGVSQFVIGGWIQGRRSLTISGPAGTIDYMEALLDEAYRIDLDSRFHHGMPAEGIKNIEVREFGAGIMAETAGYRVTACRTAHMIETYALRFDNGGPNLVLSSDTGPCPELVELSRGAHTLVHESSFLAEPGRPAVHGANFQPDFRLHHATPEQAAEAASGAGVQRLILTHFNPGRLPLSEIEARCRACYDGQVVAGEDLMTFAI